MNVWVNLPFSSNILVSETIEPKKNVEIKELNKAKNSPIFNIITVFFLIKSKVL